MEISWPNIIRIDHEYRPELTLDLSKTKPLTLDAYETPTIADLAPVIDGKPDVTKLTSIDVEKLGREQRMQRVIFRSAAEVYDLMKPNWKANREFLLAQVIRLTEKYLNSGRIVVSPGLFSQDEVRRRILYTLNMTKIVQHLWEAIRFENALAVVPVFDKERPSRTSVPNCCLTSLATTPEPLRHSTPKSLPSKNRGWGTPVTLLPDELQKWYSLFACRPQEKRKNCASGPPVLN